MTYVDQIAVERRCEGDRTVTLDRAEAAAAFHRLRARGMSGPQIARALGVSERTVTRWMSGRTRQPYRLRPVSGAAVCGEAAAAPVNTSGLREAS